MPPAFQIACEALEPFRSVGAATFSRGIEILIVAWHREQA
ncbi:hypothetical protein PLANPX_0683 [Lacipirellula parvula]|uniref:Uncharacterized protein n=1 Tax=Lacipirellula parvula TaxID=2650471 RepID=A0A5K7X8J1_9BACT|nr:hypothetical protein PLANPX_0683 [Lacipirellula parvula]